MNILFLTTHINTGGITSYLYNLSKGLIRSGHRVWIGSSLGDRADDFKKIGSELLSLNIRTKSEVNPNIYLSCLRSARFIQEMKIDVIHSHTRITQVMGALLSKMTARPYVSTCHGFFKARLFRKLFPCWGRKVIAISPAVYDHLTKDFHVAPGCIALIKTGIDVDDFSPIAPEQKQRMRQALAIPAGPVIGIIARLSQEKGHLVLIDAMAKVIQKVRQARLVIVGTGRLEQEVKMKVKANNLTDNIFFFDAVNRTAEFLSLCDLFVMPSSQEGLGLSVMEAQAAGLPVIATHVGGLVSLVEHQRTGLLVQPNNSDELARAIIYVLLHPEEARQMGSCAREFIKDECSFKEMTQKTVTLYQELVNKVNH